jgi:hypothetical protein
MPAGSGVAWKTLHPAVHEAASTEAAASPASPAYLERFFANPLAFSPPMAFFLAKFRSAQTR